MKKSQRPRMPLRYPFEFSVRVHGEKDASLLAAETEEERKDWLAAIEQSISPSMVKPAKQER